MVLIKSETLGVQQKINITPHPLFPGSERTPFFCLSNKNRASLEIRQTKDLDTLFKSEDR
jgi:hypothetical protein